ncbi:TetR/AcrR family transcriptional regulator [Clostridium bornimense]|uniref:TetR/AcrR family transcriptional regulator n=1 Tax=Clostridium bornimense TaxID=1216932 RepID=UPI001C115675|nr:TetR/AcrR family transcriptional regulator [Clostridium bornimense]MBU5317044.1 TetR/AcrR family transcriptional regulator [Clostridium bornimense]
MNKTKKAIFDAAIEVFSHCGYDGATMDEIANRAGVAKGTLYYHFKSKEEIFKFIINEGINIINESVEDGIKDIKDPHKVVKTAAKLQLRYMNDNKDLFRVIISQVWGDSERNKELREAVSKLINISNKSYHGIIDKGVVSEDDARFLGYSFIGILVSIALYDLLNGEEYDNDEIIERFLKYNDVLHILNK